MTQDEKLQAMFAPPRDSLSELRGFGHPEDGFTAFCVIMFAFCVVGFLWGILTY